MKKYNYIIVLLVACIVFAACEKKVEPVDAYDVTVEYRSTGTKYIAGDITVNPKDSIYFDFTITSPEDMSFIEIQRNGARLDTFRLTNTTSKKSFSLIKGYRVDSSAGDYTYRVLARNDRAVFMGDGGKQIKVTVTPDFDFWSYRILQVPDSTAKTNKSFFSTTTGATYSYSDGAASSAAIDFGYYYDTTSTPIANPPKNTIYALSASRFTPYDFNTWTKNATTFRIAPTSTNFITTLRSAGALRSAWASGTNSATVGRLSLSDRPTLALRASFTGTIISFRTAAGKIGAININFTNDNLANKDGFISIDVKVEK